MASGQAPSFENLPIGVAVSSLRVLFQSHAYSNGGRVGQWFRGFLLRNFFLRTCSVSPLPMILEQGGTEVALEDTVSVASEMIAAVPGRLKGSLPECG